MTEDHHQALLKAAEHFSKTARQRLTHEGRLHAETLISSTARMAGSLMYRSFNLDPTIKPGTTVLSEQANIHGPALMNLMLATLNQLGEKIDQNSLDSDFLSKKVSPLTFEESDALLAPAFLKYCKDTQLAFGDAAFGAAIACGLIVHDCREVLSVDKGAAVAVYGFVEGTKTAPFPVDELSADDEPAPKKKPWFKLW